MKLEYSIVPILALAAFSASGLIAGEVVDFNANSIYEPVYVGRARPFLEHVPTLSSDTSEGYSGAPVFTAFQTDSKSLLAVGPYDGSGLKIRWNEHEGSQGDIASGLFLFKQADFVNGYNQSPVSMEDDNDVVSLRFGYMNPGSVGADLPIAEASFRFVIKDNSGFHISGNTPIESGGEFSFHAMQQTYSAYNPYVNDGNSVGTVGGGSKPTFQNIEYVGFRVYAVRGGQIPAGSNIGVVVFSVNAK